MSRPCLAALCAVAFLFLSGFRAPPETAYGGPGTVAPDAVLETTAGENRSLPEASEAGWTLLKFGTTWCPQCARQVGELNLLAPWLRDAGVRVVEVFLKESPRAVLAEQEKIRRAYDGEVLADPDGATLPLYGVQLIPRLFLVDPGGAVRLDSGFLPADQLKDRISAALDGR